MHTLLTKIFAFIFSLFLKAVCNLNKNSVTSPDIFHKYAGEGNNIFAFWHNRLFYLAYYCAKNNKKRKTTILISMSKDGDYATALAYRLGLDAIRGSSSRGGQQAVRNLTDKASQGNNIGIAIDGPRGPVYAANEGVIKLAQLTGGRIIPVSYDATRKWELKSWDRLMIVKPFGRVHMAFGEPMEIPRNLPSDEFERYRSKLKDVLLELGRICAEELKTKDMNGKADKV